MEASLRMTKCQYDRIRTILADKPNENIFCICGQHIAKHRFYFYVHKVADSIDPVDTIITKAKKLNGIVLAISSQQIQIHSPSSCQCNPIVNSSATAIISPQGQISGWHYLANNSPRAFDCITVIGDEIVFYRDKAERYDLQEFARRHAQLFGEGTTRLIQSLSIGIVGCSGTGSIVAEQLARLGAGRLVLVDPDKIEEKNLNRILNSKVTDIGKYKTEVLAEAIDCIGLGTKVLSLPMNIESQEAIRTISECDVVFGCMDGVTGRHLLNRIAVFYLIPYFDVGIRLDADGHGGIDNICGRINYLIPDGSSLLSRGCISSEALEAESMLKTDPHEYSKRLNEGYIKGVEVERPAVITPNMFYASMVVNEFLSRLHPYRHDENALFRSYSFSLAQNQLYNFTGVDDPPCPSLAKYAGRGDMVPLLNIPQITGANLSC